MIAHERKPRPCEFCKTPTVFTMALGRRKAVDVCVPCGEKPARRAELTKAAA